MTGRSYTSLELEHAQLRLLKESDDLVQTLDHGVFLPDGLGHALRELLAE